MSCCGSQTPCDPSASRTTGSEPTPNGRSVFLQTFGCQMNELDSELVQGHLSALGYRFVEGPENADVILFNTCSVREQAENKVRSRLGELGVEKREGRSVVVGVLGCMAEREGLAMVRSMPQVDLLCGPGELDKLPGLLENAWTTRRFDPATHAALQGSTTRRSTTLGAAEDDLELLDLSRAFDPDRASAGGRSAYVRITRGCNKFCTYCVVPNTRGPEVHRPPDAIVDECRRLADRGVIEVTLLGQTVNHYLYVHGTALSLEGREVPQVGPGASAFRTPGALEKLTGRAMERGAGRLARSNGGVAAGRRVTSFADLLHRIHEEVPAIRRLRFVTSYPRDFTDEALRVIAESPRICPYLHVPAQSGSDRILGLMNRGYSVGEYLEFVDRARSIVPDVSIAGDIIVGFPTETDEDYRATRRLLERVPFKNNFIFKYSPRPGTAAIRRFEDDVPDDVRRARNNELLALQAEVSASVHAALVGRRVDVFVERVSRRTPPRHGNVELGWARPTTQLSGRTPGDHIVVFDLPPGMDEADLIGTVQPVDVEGSGPLILFGRHGPDAAGAGRDVTAAGAETTIAGPPGTFRTSS